MAELFWLVSFFFERELLFTARGDLETTSILCPPTPIPMPGLSAFLKFLSSDFSTFFSTFSIGYSLLEGRS